MVAVLIALTMTSLIAARTSHMSVRRSITRTVGVGFATMAMAYLVGHLLE